VLRIKLTKKGRAATRFKQEVEDRVEAANAEIGRQFARNTARVARAQLPTGGWFSIYREAIDFFESPDGKQWAAAGLWPQSFSTFPGDSTIVEFAGTSPVARVMAARNPWPMDSIPAVTGGYRATAKTKHGSPSELDHHRDRISGVLATVKLELAEAGVVLAPGTFPVIAGAVYADIAWFALRLEHGLGGLPRIPVWARTFAQLKREATQWAAAARPTVEPILNGASTRSPIPAMPDALLRALRAHRG